MLHFQYIFMTSFYSWRRRGIHAYTFIAVRGGRRCTAGYPNMHWVEGRKHPGEFPSLSQSLYTFRQTLLGNYEFQLLTFLSLGGTPYKQGESMHNSNRNNQLDSNLAVRRQRITLCCCSAQR